MRGTPAPSQSYCVILQFKGENDGYQRMGNRFSNNFLCLDYCHNRCLWLVEEMKRIYKFRLCPLPSSETDLLITEELIRN